MQRGDCLIPFVIEINIYKGIDCEYYGKKYYHLISLHFSSVLRYEALISFVAFNIKLKNNALVQNRFISVVYF